MIGTNDTGRGNTEGQRLMAETIQPTLARLMKKHSK